MHIAKSLLFIALIFGFLSGCDTGGNMKGVLNNDERAYIENSLNPLLVKDGVCNSAKECSYNYLKYVTCSSHNSLSCEIYGIADEKMAMEILASMFNNRIQLGQVRFWRHLNGENDFFEKPLIEFTDRTWDK